MNTNILFDLTFKRVRTAARKFYFKILGPWDPIVPALGEQVVISEEGEFKGNKKEAASRLYPRCGGMDTPQLPFVRFIIAEMGKMSSQKKNKERKVPNKPL